MTRNHVASLGMYDGGELANANDVLWGAVADRLASFGVHDVPLQLERERTLDEVWSSGRLLFGQTCGYPFASRFRGRLLLIASPQYSAPGCTPEGHRSFIIVNEKSTVWDVSGLRGSRAVINEDESMTGRHLLGDAVATVPGTPAGFFGSVQRSGSHAQSLAKVAAGDADVAAIDCVTFAHLARTAADAVARTRIVHRTRVTAALPFVMSAELGEVTAALVASALYEALVDPSTARARESLMLVGIRRPKPSVYDESLTVAANADRVFGGYASDSSPKSSRDGSEANFAFGSRMPPR